MHGVRVLLLLAPLLVAGCASAPERDPPSAATPSPAPSTAGPSTGAPSPPPADECVQMTLSAEPVAIRPGEEVVFQGVIRNCGAHPLRYDHTCLSPPWHPRVVVDGRTYHALTNGSALREWACPSILVHAAIPPGGSMEASWRWNGTLQECHDRCAPFDAPPGALRFTSFLARKASDGFEVERDGWSASTVVEVLPRE